MTDAEMQSKLLQMEDGYKRHIIALKHEIRLLKAVPQDIEPLLRENSKLRKGLEQSDHECRRLRRLVEPMQAEVKLARKKIDQTRFIAFVTTAVGIGASVAAHRLDWNNESVAALAGVAVIAMVVGSIVWVSRQLALPSR